MSQTEIIIYTVELLACVGIFLFVRRRKGIEFVPELVMSLESTDVKMWSVQEDRVTAVALSLEELRPLISDDYCSRLDALEDTCKYILIYNHKITKCSFFSIPKSSEGTPFGRALYISRVEDLSVDMLLYKVPAEHSDFLATISCDSEDGKPM